MSTEQDDAYVSMESWEPVGTYSVTVWHLDMHDKLKAHTHEAGSLASVERYVDQVFRTGLTVSVVGDLDFAPSKAERFTVYPPHRIRSISYHADYESPAE